MVARRPVVFISGQQTELPPGDVIEGGSLGDLTAGSGLDGGGNLIDTTTVNVSLAPNASGLIFVDDKYLASDGVAQRTSELALASGVYALEVSEAAIASGTAGSLLAATALASGNAALDTLAVLPVGTIETFTAASAVVSGYAVGLDDTGSVQSIREIIDIDRRGFGSPVVFESATSTYISSTYDSTNERVVIAYRDGGNSNYGTTVVGTVSGTSISFGSPVVFESANSTYISSTYDSTNDRVVTAFRDGGNSNYGTAIVGTVSGTSISFGTPVVFESASSDHISATYDSTNDRVVTAFRDGGNSNYGTAIVGTVSGTSISFGTAVVFKSANSTNISSTYDSTNDRVVTAFRDAGNFTYGSAVVGTVSGTSISFGSVVNIDNEPTSAISSTYDSTNDRVVIAYEGEVPDRGYAIVGTVSDTSISFGSPVVFKNSLIGFSSSTYDSTNNRVVIDFRDEDNSNYGTTVVGTVSGTSISFGSPVVFESANSTYISSTYDSTNDRVVTAYRDGGNSNYGTAIVSFPFSYPGPTISSQNNFIGIAQDTVASGTTVPVRLPGSYDQNNQGLVVGSSYYVDPTTSGFTTTSTQPNSWSGAVNWAPVGVAVNSTTLLLTDTI